MFSPEGKGGVDGSIHAQAEMLPPRSPPPPVDDPDPAPISRHERGRPIFPGYLHQAFEEIKNPESGQDPRPAE